MQLFVVKDAETGDNERLIPANNGVDAQKLYQEHLKRTGYIFEVLGKHSDKVFALPRLWTRK